VKKSDLKLGAGIASAVALMLGATVPASADDAKETKSVKCMGGNSCKGKSACATADTSCAGQNSCKGKGWITMKSADECTKAGGHIASKKEAPPM
jgi:uncharacterized membrane protein